MNKVLYNKSSSIVDESLECLVQLNPGLKLIKNERIVIRADIENIIEKDQVTIVSGGGSGHEPTHAGYVGKGMLSAAVCGSIFASPSSSHIEFALRKTKSKGGCLVIVTNYTGDRINFGLAVEHLKNQGFLIKMIIIGEDCANHPTCHYANGRRGLAGTIFVHKIAGAMAEMGFDLECIVKEITNISKNMGTIGISLSSITLPGSEKALFNLPDDVFTLGLGIHGEIGAFQEKMASAKYIARKMFDHMTSIDNPVHFKITEVPVAVIVNNLGGLSTIELNVFANEIIQLLKDKKIVVERFYIGMFMTSLNMSGVSLTLLSISDARYLQFLDFPTETCGWGRRSGQIENNYQLTIEEDKKEMFQECKYTLNSETELKLRTSFLKIIKEFQKEEKYLNNLDSIAGDGDCGTTFLQGINSINSKLECNLLILKELPNLFLQLSNIAQTDMGGTSGGLYSVFFMAAIPKLQENCEIKNIIDAFESGINAIQLYGGAKRNDRTMLDVLIPVLNCLKKNEIKDLCVVTDESIQSTCKMTPKAGRAAYTNSVLNLPDAGAYAAGIWIKCLCNGFFN